MSLILNNMQNKKNKEIEVRFLEVDKSGLKEKLLSLGGADLGEELLEEIIFYGKDVAWEGKTKKFVRVRKNSKRVTLAYKDHSVRSLGETEEIECVVDDFDKVCLLLERIGLAPFRRQEKRRHTFTLGNVTVDIDTWPSLPTFVELEGQSEGELKEAAMKLGLDWKSRHVGSVRELMEEHYNLPVGTYRVYTFDHIE